MTVGPRLEEVARVNAAFAEFSEAQAVPLEVRRSMLVVLDELLANIISYGLATDGGGEAAIEVVLGAESLTVTLSDNAAAFDPFARAAPDTTLSVEERPIGGLGIHLVRHMVDEVSYQRSGDRNVTVLVKRLVANTSNGSTGEE